MAVWSSVLINTAQLLQPLKRYNFAFGFGFVPRLRLCLLGSLVLDNETQSLTGESTLNHN